MISQYFNKIIQQSFKLKNFNFKTYCEKTSKVSQIITYPLVINYYLKSETFSSNVHDFLFLDYRKNKTFDYYIIVPLLAIPPTFIISLATPYVIGVCPIGGLLWSYDKLTKKH